MSARPLRWLPFYYGWLVVALAFMTSLIAAGVRSGLPVFIRPLEAELGWSRAALSAAISLNLLVYGIGSPLAGRLMDRFGPRQVMATSLALLAVGAAGMVWVRAYWQLLLVWGLAIGLGAGGAATVLAAAVAARWFVARRGLVLGLLNSATSTGQLIFLPILMALVVSVGWKAGAGMLAAVALGLTPLVLLLMRDEPAQVGLQPYGADRVAGPGESDQEAREGASVAGAAAPAPKAAERPATLRQVVRSPVFWLLAGSFFTCGATSSGLIGTHLIPHSLDHGIPEVVAATTVGVMGSMNFIGTMLSGWLTDRVDTRRLLAAVFTLRSVSLFVLPFVHDLPGLLVFAIVYGLDWFATVPPVVALTADEFGRRSVASVYGWIFLSHQVGSSLAAMGGGFVRVWWGDYMPAFLAGGVLALVGAALALGVPARQRQLPAPQTRPAVA